MPIYVKSKNEKNNSKIVDYAKEAITLFEPNFSLKNENIYKFQRITYVLGDLIKVQGHKYNTHEKRWLIQKGLERYSKYKKKNISYLMMAINKEIVEKNKEKKNKYILIFPLNINYNWMKKKRHFILENHKILLRNYTHVQKNYDFTEPNSMLKRIRTLDYTNFTYAILLFTDRNYMIAINKAVDTIELMRAIFNFTLSYGSLTRSIGEPRPLSDFGPPKYGFAFDNEKKFVGLGEIYPHIAHHRAFRPTLYQDEKRDAIVKYISIYRLLINSTLKELLKQVLFLYNSALDDIGIHFSYLHFWQILELIFSGGQSKYEVILKRMKNLFKKDEKISYIIDIISKKRHLLVHEGRMKEFEQEDIHRIKVLVDAVINTLFNHTNVIKTRSNLTYFFNNVGKDNKKIDDQISMLKYIIKIKQ